MKSTKSRQRKIESVGQQKLKTNKSPWTFVNIKAFRELKNLYFFHEYVVASSNKESLRTNGCHTTRHNHRCKPTVKDFISWLQFYHRVWIFKERMKIYHYYPENAIFTCPRKNLIFFPNTPSPLMHLCLMSCLAIFSLFRETKDQ